MSRDQWTSWSDLLPLAVGIWLVSQLVAIWVVRIPHPFDLEWMEGGMLAHAWRVQQGLPVYTEPSPDWIPYIYPPGFATVLATVGQVFGLSYGMARSVTLFGTLAAAAALVFGVTRHTARPLVGVLAAIAFLGCYPHSGAFYDLVRLDGLYVGLLAWSVVLALEERRGALEGSALLLFVAFLFKQNVALFGIPIALALWKRGGRAEAVRYFAWSGVPALSVTAFMQWQTDGVYLKYLLAVPSSHPIVGQRAYPGTPRELGWALAPVVVMAAGWLIWRAREQGLSSRWLQAAGVLAVAGAVLDVALPQIGGTPEVPVVLSAPTTGALWACLVVVVGMAWTYGRQLSWQWVLVLGLGVVGLGTTMLMRGHHGGFLNVHIQLFWLVCLAGGVAVAQARERAQWTMVASALVFAVLYGTQSAVLGSRNLLPTAADRSHGEHVVSLIAEQEGPVLSAYAPWLAQQAGHEPGFHLIALWDVAHKNSPFPGVTDQMSEAAELQHWGAVVAGPKRYRFEVDRHYKTSANLSADRGVFVPKTGWRASPRRLMVPK